MGRELARKGNYAEIRVMADAVKRGYSVSVPHGHETRYDLIIDKLGTLLRTQVKHASIFRGAVLVKCQSTTGSGWDVPYKDGEIDMIAAYEPTSDMVYYLPWLLVSGNTRALSLRLLPTRNNQTRGTRLASNYLDF